MKTRSRRQYSATQSNCPPLTVVASHETKSVVNEVPSKTDEAARDRVCGGHLGDAVVHQAEEASIDGVRQEQAAWAAFVETAADADEESGANGAANGHQLDLSVSQAAVEVIVVLDDLAFFVAVDAADGVGRDILADLLVMFEDGHGGGEWVVGGGLLLLLLAPRRRRLWLDIYRRHGFTLWRGQWLAGEMPWRTRTPLAVKLRSRPGA